MNDSQLNGFDLNSTSVFGANAILTGGLVSTVAVSSKAVISAILIGGLFSASDAEGAISQRLQGGVYSTPSVGGKYRTSAFLKGNIISSCQVNSKEMGVNPSLRDGVYSASTWGGTIIADAKLKPKDQPGQNSSVGSNVMAIGHVLTDGIKTTGYVMARLAGGHVLMGDGIKSKSIIGESDIKTGRLLSGGMASTVTVGGKTKWPAKLTGGILGTWELGKEIDINAKLQGAVYGLNGVGGTFLINGVFSGGIQNSNLFTSKQQISPFANGGVESSTEFSAKYKIIAKLQQGVSSDNMIGGKGITASQVLRSGLTSTTNGLESGQIKTYPRLQGYLASSQSLGGDVVPGFLDPLLNTWALEIRSATVILEVKHPTEDI
jgi:hypothetical protein